MDAAIIHHLLFLAFLVLSPFGRASDLFSVLCVASSIFDLFAGILLSSSSNANLALLRRVFGCEEVMLSVRKGDRVITEVICRVGARFVC